MVTTCAGYTHCSTIFAPQNTPAIHQTWPACSLTRPRNFPVMILQIALNCAHQGIRGWVDKVLKGEPANFQAEMYAFWNQTKASELFSNLPGKKAVHAFNGVAFKMYPQQPLRRNAWEGQERVQTQCESNTTGPQYKWGNGQTAFEDCLILCSSWQGNVDCLKLFGFRFSCSGCCFHVPCPFKALQWLQ